MRKSYLLIILAVLAALVLSACGGSGDDGGFADDAAVAAGEDLFSQDMIGSQAGCKTCHSLTPGENIVGPSLAGIGNRAGDTVSGQSAEDYVRESILNPNAHLVDGFAEGIMPQNWDDNLSDEDLDNLVAYLLSLK